MVQMTHEKWFISDTHFFHANTWLKFKNKDGSPMRPFSSTEEMNEYMVDKWNSVVKDNDYVYHLGDVTFRYDGPFSQIMSRLKGKKRLIIGNHDKLTNPSLFKWFEKVEYWKGFPHKIWGFTAFHMPLPIEGLRDGGFCVHGHVHPNSLPDSRYINVCVEVRDYTPVHYDQIVKEILSA